MRKAVLLLTWLLLGICCLITFYSTKDTVLKDISSKEETSTRQEAQQETQQETQQEVHHELQLINQNNRYAFSCLTEDERQLYLEILSVLLQQGKETVLPSTEEEALEKVFSSVLIDYPEIFYVDGYQYTEGKMVSFQPNYLYNETEIQKRQEAIAQSAEALLVNLEPDAADYDKVRYVYEAIIQSTEYDPEAVDNQNICSVFLTHRSVCQGYAKATQYLLNMLGMEAALVTGTVKDAEGHAWNLVRIDGKYYYLDTTWGDACYQLTGEPSMVERMREPTINYDYLNVTTEQLLMTHTIHSIIPLPVCESMDANYYVMEGAYFTDYDESRIAKLFQKAQSEGQESVTIKCDNEENYNLIFQKLIQEQKIFSYLPNQKGTVAYTDSREQRSISFWL